MLMIKTQLLSFLLLLVTPMLPCHGRLCLFLSLNRSNTLKRAAAKIHKLTLVSKCSAPQGHSSELEGQSVHTHPVPVSRVLSSAGGLWERNYYLVAQK